LTVLLSTFDLTCSFKFKVSIILQQIVRFENIKFAILAKYPPAGSADHFTLPFFHNPIDFSVLFHFIAGTWKTLCIFV